MRTLVWFRGKDLRLADHTPLASALGAGEVVPLFVLDPFFFAPERAQQTPHRIQFLLESLAELMANIEQRGSRLLLATGKSHELIPELAQRWRVQRVVAQAWAWPIGRERDRRVREKLSVPFELFEGETLLAPGSLRAGAGTPYNVFTPFARAFLKTIDIARPLPAPAALPALPGDVLTTGLGEVTLPSLSDLGIQHNPELLVGGESEAQRRLAAFLKNGARHYGQRRDRMDQSGTSRLSCDLKFGTLSIREVWTRLGRAEDEGRSTFANELIWREFTHSTLHDKPELLEEPFQAKFEGFPWRPDDAGWRAWAEGTTGYPVVDASARQLLSEGFVHNRARMISASFLTKHLLVDYKRGEAHYMRLLTDGDEANNNAGWQWSAGCGCDAQPYFRIFNPVTQGQKFDPDGAYVRRWLPALARMPARFIHQPWQAPPAVLEQAGVRLGIDYPRPIVEHAAARQRFLDTASAHFGARALPRPDASGRAS
jgi:deoxyribodipyrimidine photo-lyase